MSEVGARKEKALFCREAQHNSIKTNMATEKSGLRTVKSTTVNLSGIHLREDISNPPPRTGIKMAGPEHHIKSTKLTQKLCRCRLVR